MKTALAQGKRLCELLSGDPLDALDVIENHQIDGCFLLTEQPITAINALTDTMIISDELFDMLRPYFCVFDLSVDIDYVR
jgi:hypothetical protein